MKRLLSLLILSFSTLMLKANYWTPNPYQYPNNMTVIGVVSFNGVEQNSDALEIGAFCGDECRGSSILQYEETFDRCFVFMMIYGNSGDDINFRCYNHNINMELDMIAESSMTFQTNAMIGGVVEPFVFSFQSYQHVISLDIVPEIGGAVSGDGTYNKYDTCFINVTPNAGYQFDALVENGDTVTKQSSYSFIVLSERNFTAHFSEMPIYYQITAEANPSTGGNVTGVGQYLEDETCNLMVSTNPGYIYEGLYEDEQLVTTDTVYSFVAAGDRHFVAEFSVQINYYQVSADVTPDGAGLVSGLGAYQEGETCELEITPNEGYHFVALKENDTIVSEEPSYNFVVESDRFFIAEFELREYEILLQASPEEGGSLAGAGTYKHGETVYAIAIPNANYIFEKWTHDGNTISSNPQYVFEANESMELVAHFIYQDDVTENEDYRLKIYPNPTSNFIIVENDSECCEVTIHDMTGKVMLKAELNSDENKVDVTGLPHGIYIITVDDGNYVIKEKFVKN